MNCILTWCDQPAFGHDAVCDHHRQIEWVEACHWYDQALTDGWTGIHPPTATHPPKPTPPVTYRPGGRDGDRVAAVLARLRHDLETGDGGRNNQLARASFTVGGLVGAGRLDEEAARAWLTAAAEHLCPDERWKAQDTVRRGLRRGQQHPLHP